jgi:3-oxoacyl-(acyl-carrier-protein) synthase
MTRVVVTGIGVIAPCGIGADEFWDNTAAGRSYIEREPEMVAIGTASTVTSRVRSFDPRHFFSADDPLLAEDRFIQYGVAAGQMAVEDARLDELDGEAEAVGCIAATAIGGTPTVAAAWQQLTGGGVEPLRWGPVGATLAHAICSNYPGAVLMRRYGFGGVSAALSTGCTAGLDALGLAFETVQSGEAVAMLAGAAEAPLADISYATLDVIGSLSVVDGDPAGASCPFDARRAGFVLAEAAAFLVLEERDHALERGARAYAEVLGFASVSNALHMSDLPAHGYPMSCAIERALEAAAVDPHEIDYVNAHGSSTPQNDVFETNAYKRIFGARAAAVPISSTKSMVGHSLSSASLVGAIAALGAIGRGEVHPTANWRVADPDCDLDYVTGGCRRCDVCTAMVTASGFGGIHSVAVLRRCEAGDG